MNGNLFVHEFEEGWKVVNDATGAHLGDGFPTREQAEEFMKAQFDGAAPICAH